MGVEKVEQTTGGEVAVYHHWQEDYYRMCRMYKYEKTRAEALETENAQHVNAIECLRQERDEIVLALMWCKPRLKQEAYQTHIEWTLTKYPRPPKVEEPRIVRSFANPDDDFCPSDPRGPGGVGR